MLGRIVGRIVHAQHDGDVLVLGRRGDDYLFYRTAEVLGGVLGVGESAGGFHHHLRAHAGPIELGRVLDGEDLDFLTVHRDGIGIGGDFGAERSEHRVVLEQVRQRFRIGQIVDRDEFHVTPVQCRPDDIPANAAKAVDTHFYCHFVSCIYRGWN